MGEGIAFWMWLVAGASSIAGLIGAGAWIGRHLFPKDDNPDLLDEIGRKNKCVIQLTDQLGEAQSRLENQARVFETLETSEAALWMLHDAFAPEGHAAQIAAASPPVLLIANLKGGVGKTTLAANLGAFFSEKTHLFRQNGEANKNVLLIDLDFQGSLSDSMMRAAGLGLVTSLADGLLAGREDHNFVVNASVPLVSVNPRLRLITSQYVLAREENQLLFKWAFQGPEPDHRYNLARALQHPTISAAFDLIIIDAAPRMSFAMVEAIAASTHLLVPTTLDGLSIEAVGNFLGLASALRMQLNPGLQLAGVVGTMYPRAILGDDAQDALATLREATEEWQGNRHVFANHLPLKADIRRAAGQSVPYIHSQDVQQLVDVVGYELAQRMGLQ